MFVVVVVVVGVVVVVAREPMAMALTQAPRTGALVPMGVGVARLFLKKF